MPAFASARLTFLSTSPAWGTTAFLLPHIDVYAFLSTSPAWGTTRTTPRASNTCRTFYPRPPRGGRHLDVGQRHKCMGLSIHVPRVGDDPAKMDAIAGRMKTFYPRPPRGGRPAFLLPHIDVYAFLSTSPAWGTTPIAFAIISTHACFLSTSPAWGTTSSRQGRILCSSLSIHVPRVGDDQAGRDSWSVPSLLSIHVPRVGDDTNVFAKSACMTDFYPRPPRGGRLINGVLHKRYDAFYPRPPRGGRLCED